VVVAEMQTRADGLPAQIRDVYPWKGHTLEVDGGLLHYLDEGPADAEETLVCVHGNPTWSFYWRAVVRQFSDRYRVVVPDHIGCGLSDKPQDWSYRLEDHVDNLEKLVQHLGLERITWVVHDWGGAIGMGVATRHPELVQRLVITNTAAFLSKAIPPSIASVKVPGFGTLAVRGFNAFAFAATLRAVSKPLSPVAKAGLLHPYNNWANRIATLRFVQDIPLTKSHPSFEALETIDGGLAELTDKPMLLMWGDDDFCFTPRFRAEWERRFPDAEVHAWNGVGHYVMEDATERVLSLMEGFLDSAAPQG
jgi:haloalkane dehalogenase